MDNEFENKQPEHPERPAPPDFEKQKTKNPPPFNIEKEWAERLKMNFEPEKAQLPPEPPKPEENVFIAVTEPPRPKEPMPKSFLVWSIVATLLCCMPAGVVAIIYSSMVAGKYYTGDYEGAKKCSERAEIWIIASIVLSVIGNALSLPLSLML